MPLPFFEGPEKKVELAVVDGHPSLRALGEAFWRGVVKAANADVLSVLSNAHLDAYLLSESSLFVYDGFCITPCLQISPKVCSWIKIADNIDIHSRALKQKSPLQCAVSVISVTAIKYTHIK